MFISYGFPAVAQITMRIAVMRRGKLVATGVAEQALGHPREDYTREQLAAVLAI